MLFADVVVVVAAENMQIFLLDVFIKNSSELKKTVKYIIINE